MLREGGRGGVVEDQGRGQAQAGRGVQGFAQFDRGERIEAEFGERPVRFDRLGAAPVAEHLRDLVPYRRQGHRLLFGGRQTREAVGEFRGRAAGCGRRGGPAVTGVAYGRQLVEERAGAGCGEGGGEPGPVDVRDRHAGVGAVHGPAQRADGPLRVHRQQSALAQVVAGGGGTRHAVAGPRAPGDRGGGESGGVPALRESVQEGVRDGVRGLATAAPDGGDGREQHERFQGYVGKRLVQVDGAGNLGLESGREVGEPGLRQGGEGAGAGRVEDRRERKVVRDVAQERVHRAPVRDVAGDDGDLGAARPEFGGQGGGRGGGRAPAAGQQEVRGAPVREPARDVRAERARAAGDQDGAGRLPGVGGRGLGRVDEAASEQSGLPYRDLVLVAAVGQHSCQPSAGTGVQRPGAGGQVHQPGPAARVLQGGDPAEGPHLSAGDARQFLAGCHGDRAARGQPERGLDARVSERLEEGDGTGDAGGQRRVAGGRSLVGGEEGEHSGEGDSCGALSQLTCQGLAFD